MHFLEELGWDEELGRVLVSIPVPGQVQGARYHTIPGQVRISPGISDLEISQIESKSLILPPSVAAGNVEDLETLWTGPWDMGLKSSVKSKMLRTYSNMCDIKCPWCI